MFTFKSSRFLVLSGLGIFLISGCLGSGVETPATKELKDSIVPTIALASPSATKVRNGSAAVTIAATFTNAKGVDLDSSDVGLTTTGSGVSCTVTFSGVTDAGASIRLSACTGNGTVRAYIKAGSISSATGRTNAQSSSSAAITVDNTGPIISSMTPTTGPVVSIPTSLVVTFSEAVDTDDIDASLFVVTGTCGTLPTPGTPVMSNGNTVATVPLSGDVCADNETTIVTVTTSSVHDAIGNAGTGSAIRTYTFTEGPTVVFGAPSLAVVNSSSPAVDILATFTNNIPTPTIDGTTVGITATGDAACSTISGSGVSNTSATIQVSGCTGDGTIAVFMNAGSLESGSGTPNLQSSDSATVDVDNTGPNVLSMTPTTATVNSSPSSIVVTFDEPIDGGSISNANFVLSGTCSTSPTVGAVMMSVGDTVATTSITGNCLHNETLIVTFTPSSVTDVAGNAGVGAALAPTYTYDLNGPIVTLGAPSVTRVSSGSAAFTSVVSISGGTTVPVLDGTTVGFTTNSGVASCSTVTSSGVLATGGTLHISGCTGDGELAIHVLANTVQDALGNDNVQSADSAAFTVDNTAPTPLSFTPATQTRNSQITSFAVTYDEAVQSASVVDTDFIIDGASTCGVLPSVGTPVLSVSDTVATMPLTGGSCGHNETLIISTAGSSILDLVGHTGTGSATATYTFDFVGPTISSLSPFAATNATITVTFSEPVVGMDDTKFVISGCSTSPVASNFQANGTNDVFSIDLDDSAAVCANPDDLVVSVDAGAVTDVPGNTGTGGVTQQNFPIP